MFANKIVKFRLAPLGAHCEGDGSFTIFVSCNTSNSRSVQLALQLKDFGV